ncbi:MAG: TIGR03617 family F420-dependent LLM class oxidoreductase [Chloroflexi bacterium]|nr:TIGR03617 family F420-dependent LLM class oxidoreductase [Chloroflexota bacterium]
MHLDVTFLAPYLDQVPALAQAADQVGFDAFWVSETRYNPFLALTLAAEHSQRLFLGTAVAIAFARSPMVTAQTAWDLQRYSHGRFLLGLGTQVRAHIERRFGMPWDPPVPKLREYILALREIWASWQERRPVRFRGRFYTITLMTDFFNPGPIAHPRIPIYIAGVNRGLIRLAGQMADGFHVHPLHSVRYLREVLLPTLVEGLRDAGRSRREIALAATVLVVTGPNERERARARRFVRQQIAFYASTPSYRLVFDLHGWSAVAERLSRMAARGEWDEMASLITDEMLHTFAVDAAWDALPQALIQRYEGLLDRIALYYRFRPEAQEAWRAFYQTWRATLAQRYADAEP